MSHSMNELFLFDSIMDGTEDKTSISFDFKLEDIIKEEGKEELLGDVENKEVKIEEALREVVDKLVVNLSEPFIKEVNEGKDSNNVENELEFKSLVGYDNIGDLKLSLDEEIYAEIGIVDFILFIIEEEYIDDGISEVIIEEEEILGINLVDSGIVINVELGSE